MTDELDFIQPEKVIGKMISMSVLEDIKAAIEREKIIYTNDDRDTGIDYGARLGLNIAIEIIDRYISGKAEREVQDADIT